MPDNRDHQRPKTNPSALVAGGGEVVEEIKREATGVLQGEELRTERRKRSDTERVEHVEERLDELVNRVEQRFDAMGKDITQLRVDSAREMGNFAAGVGRLAGEVAGMAKVIESNAKRGELVFEADVKVGTAKELDKIDQKKTRRERWTQLIKGVLGGGVVLELLHRMFG